MPGYTCLVTHASHTSRHALQKEVSKQSQKNSIAPFYHWIPETGICADSWFLESNGIKVQWEFSLIINRALHRAGLFCPPGYTFYSNSTPHLCWFCCLSTSLMLLMSLTFCVCVCVCVVCVCVCVFTDILERERERKGGRESE